MSELLRLMETNYDVSLWRNILETNGIVPKQKKIKLWPHLGLVTMVHCKIIIEAKYK